MHVLLQNQSGSKFRGPKLHLLNLHLPPFNGVSGSILCPQYKPVHDYEQLLDFIKNQKPLRTTTRPLNKQKVNCLRLLFSCFWVRQKHAYPKTRQSPYACQSPVTFGERRKTQSIYFLVFAVPKNMHTRKYTTRPPRKSSKPFRHTLLFSFVFASLL